MIEINYIATGGYIQYFNLFKETLCHFFPKVKKVVNVITDANIEPTYINDDVVEMRVIRLYDLIYPCINLNKTYLLTQISRGESEYVFYFDADTYFNPMNDFFWEKFKERMDDGYFCIGKHPYYSLSDEDEYKERDIEIFFSCMTERDESQVSYIDSYYYTYIISSFFCGKRDVFLSVCERITGMIRQNMTRNSGYRIPLYMDENYFNRVVYDYEFKGDDTHKFDVREYILLGNSLNKENMENAFITQKNYNKDFKVNRQ